jgi:hypothetical protein
VVAGGLGGGEVQFTEMIILLTAITIMAAAVVTIMGKYPPDSFSERKRWIVTISAACIAMAAVGGIVLIS